MNCSFQLTLQLSQMDWIVWPPSQLINFLYVAPAYRMLYVSTVTVVWNVFMSYAKHSV